MDRVISFDNCVDPRRFPHDPNPFSLMDRGGVISTSGKPQQGIPKNARFGHPRSDLLVGELFEREFWAYFHIPDTIPIKVLMAKLFRQSTSRIT